MRQIGSNEIHLWLACDREIHDPELLAAYRELLSPEEQQQAQRFHFEKDRHQYLVTRALTRTVLSEYAPVAARDWRFGKLEHGRPWPENPEAGNLVFNLTHSAGLIVLGITRGNELGIDTENIVEREPPLDITNRYFSPQEAGDLGKLPRADQVERFFHYWTLKESYIKARSQGLAIPLDRFAFTYANQHSIAISIDATLEDAPENWRFWLLRPFPTHLLAICTRRTGSQPQRLLLQHIVPLAKTHPCQAVILRQSVDDAATNTE